MKRKYLKYPNQNILDYLLTNYGNIDSLFSFMAEAKLNSTDEFYNDVRSFNLEVIPLNEVNVSYSRKGIIVGTDDQSDYNTELVYNNDLSFKSIILGDYNNDFNNDFVIPEGLTVITVGYEGMTLTVEFSISNIGTLSSITDGTITLTKGLDIISKQYSAEVLANNTTIIKVDFPNLTYGVYDVSLTSSNPVINTTETIGVLGKPIFTCNNNLAITAGTVIVDTNVTLSWSITNTGNRAGFYQGFSYCESGGYVDYNISIGIGETIVIDRIVYLTRDYLTFKSSCGQEITLIA